MRNLRWRGHGTCARHRSRQLCRQALKAEQESLRCVWHNKPVQPWRGMGSLGHGRRGGKRKAPDEKSPVRCFVADYKSPRSPNNPSAVSSPSVIVGRYTFEMISISPCWLPWTYQRQRGCFPASLALIQVAALAETGLALPVPRSGSRQRCA